VLPSSVDALPEWLLVGVLLGVVSSVAVAVLFYVLVRRFPGNTHGTNGAAGASESEERRRVEMRRYLDAIGEPYVEGHVVAGHPVAFYLAECDVAVTFDPRAFYRIAHSETEAVLVEHELPGVALGHRLPFETPSVDLGTETGGGDTSTATAYSVLGVPSGAGVDEVRAAYREKVKEVHPDLGGDEDEFKRVQEAYTTARRDAD
jgi:DnaJ-domain-containing protein 1